MKRTASLLALLSLTCHLAAQSPDENFSAIAKLSLVGDAQARGPVLRLTPSRRFVRGAVWRTTKVPVRDGFETVFTFQISDRQGMGGGADGFAFVIQNNGPKAIAGRGASGGFGFGDGQGIKDRPAIANSLAIFFDTFKNEEDRSGNSISICTNGNTDEMTWPPPRLAINDRPKVRLKDGRPHHVRINFNPPLLTVYVDDELAVRAPVDLARMVGPNGAAYVGFTAATGEGYENHDIFDWRFRSVTSDIYEVTSSISFATFDCLPSKSLCTPPQAFIERAPTGEFHVILPAHLPWSAQIPNPENLPVEIKNARGTACWDPDAGACGPPNLKDLGAPGAILMKTENGHTRFAISDTNYPDNQGFFEFDAILGKP